MTELEQYGRKLAVPPTAGAIINETAIAGGKGLTRRASYGDPPQQITQKFNIEPLRFGNAYNQPSPLIKQISHDSGLPPMPGAKTPKEKLKICFGTPLQRPDSKHSLERPASRTQKQLKFKNESAKKLTNIQFEQPPANFQFSKRLSKKSLHKGSAAPRDSISASGLSGKENASQLTYADGRSPVAPATHLYFGSQQPFQDLSNRKAPQLPNAKQSEYLLEEPLPTSPFVLEYPCKALAERRVIPADNSQLSTESTPFDVAELKNFSYNNTLTTSIIVQPTLPIQTTEPTKQAGPLLPSNLSLDQFIKGKRLGKGHFGEVFVVKHKLTGFVCALKVVSKEHIINEKVTEQIIRQLKIHSCIKHSNVIGLYGFFFDEKNLYILQELCTDGQLYDMLKKKRRISEKYTAYIIRQLLEGLRYLHMNSIFHRDIKPENILMENGVVKICDFGWAVHCIGMRNTRCGTPLYLSPEIVRGEAYDEKIDIWAVGVMTYELITGSIPFHIWCEEDVKKIAEEEVKFPPYIDISDHAKDFILKALNKDPTCRLGLLDLYYHPFLSGSNEMQFVSESQQCSD